MVIGSAVRFDLYSEKRGNLGHMIPVDHDGGRPAVDDRPCAGPQSIGKLSGCWRRVGRPDYKFLFPRV